MFLVSAHLLCTYGFINQAADTYVDQLQSCRPEILYPNLSMTPQNRNPEKYTVFDGNQSAVEFR